MVIYQRVADGLLYNFKWIQERLSAPPVIYAHAQDHLGKSIRNANRMDFVTLSPESFRRPSISPVTSASSVEGAKK